MRRLAALGWALAALGCVAEAEAVSEVVAPPRWEAEGDAARGRALFARFECARCHALAETEPPPAGRDCTGCHRAIHDGSYDAPAPTLARWRASVVSLVHVPSLDAARARLSRDWVASFLVQPHDVRPALPATMPRLALGRDDARDLATFLVPSPPPAALELPRDAPTLARGRARFEALGCGGCHAFERPVGAGPRDAARVLAPDLRFARDRMPAATLVAWLLDPAPPMPRLITDRADALAIAAYLVHTPLAPPTPSPAAAPLPLLERPVGFAEVRDRVLRRSCWHCHSDEGLALGEGGPGNTGGFGFPARGLDLSDYVGVMSGSLDDEGARRSVFREDARGVPVLIAVLEARAREERGERSSLRGMPLGLPAVSPEDLQLVRSWVAQGRPQ